MSKTIDNDSVRRLAELLDETGLTEIEYDNGDIRIRVARQQAGAVAYAPLPGALPAPAEAGGPPLEAGGSASEVPAAVSADHPGAVTSPMVGTVYLSPEPGAATFIGVGDSVSVGQTLMLVEAMKTFNEIKAPHAGTVRQIVVENGIPVEFGDVLAIVE
ncbi:MAG: acetyl-CoA carboxylase biotin carboxyl carrier protein [Rhodospirillaceae bacterium]|nr:acetyl-CoA carboxylase biotin carboxyl carrier protein [Rhodospirillaceae bacterium]